MDRAEFDARLRRLMEEHEQFVSRPNAVAPGGNGIFERYVNPVLTAAHAPIFWRYDLSHETNPRLLERLGVNAAFNVGAIELDGRVLLAARVEAHRGDGDRLRAGGLRQLADHRRRGRRRLDAVGVEAPGCRDRVAQGVVRGA